MALAVIGRRGYSAPLDLVSIQVALAKAVAPQMAAPRMAAPNVAVRNRFWQAYFWQAYIGWLLSSTPPEHGGGYHQRYAVRVREP